MEKKRSYTKWCLWSISIIFLLSNTFMTISATNIESPPHLITQLTITSTQQKALVNTEKITILEHHPHEQTCIALLTLEQYNMLQKAGFNPTVLTTNLKEFIEQQMTPADIRAFHTYTQMTAALQTIATTYPTLTKLYDLGHSVQGRTIWGLKITDNPEIEENEPEVRICGLHHGNEYMSAEVPLLLAYHLTENYSSVPSITSLVNNREIWVIPMVNPDGREAGTRYNANGVDLNRDYGYMWDTGWTSPAPFSQPETQAIRNHAMENNFVLSLSFHTSGDIVNYVWNYKHEPAPDDAAVEYLSNKYASYNGYWVTDGYDWYQTQGDTNDFSYGCRGDIDWTIEIQNSNMEQAWTKNQNGILDIITYANMGINGMVTDATTGDPISATLWVENNNWPCFTDPLIGDYHRILLPGTYILHCRANGYQEQSTSITVTDINTPVYHNFSLYPGTTYYAYQVTSVIYTDPYTYPNDFQNNPTEAVDALGPPDSICSSLGVGGTLVVDMGVDIIDLASEPDFKIYEGDSGTDGYHVYVSTSWDGPWTSIGTGMGTMSFDLATSGLSAARYIKIIDDNNGSPTEMNPGVDIDAVENLAAANLNFPPATPSQPTGPTEGDMGVSYTYSTMTADPNNDTIFYQWDWGDGITTTWFGPYVSGETVEATHTWLSAGDFEIKVRAKDSNGCESNWSPPLLVHMIAAPLLEIGDINGGLRIHFDVYNHGLAEATNIDWRIYFTGGLILFKGGSQGTIPSIPINQSIPVTTGFILGFGKTNITVSLGLLQKSTSAYIIGPFILIPK